MKKRKKNKCKSSKQIQKRKTSQQSESCEKGIVNSVLVVVSPMPRKKGAR